MAIALGVGAGLGTIGPGIGLGSGVGKAMEAIGRNPEAQPKIQSTMILGLAFIEACAIYALVIAFLVKPVLARAPRGRRGRLVRLDKEPVLAALIGLATAFRMMRLPDPVSSGAVEGAAFG